MSTGLENLFDNDLYSRVFFRYFLSSGMLTGLNFRKMYPRAIGYTHITSGTNPWTPLRFNPRFLEEYVCQDSLVGSPILMVHI